MTAARLIPCLLYRDGALVKGVRFKKHRYVGDPINAIHILSEKGADELVLLDISATASGAGPDFSMLAKVASEAFMPLAYGGGVDSIDHMNRIFALGFEKVVLNTAAFEQPQLLRRAADRFGSQSIVASMDVGRTCFASRAVFTRSGSARVKGGPVKLACDLEAAGAGEILLGAIERDGTWQGYDLDQVREIAAAVSIPVVACGGAGSLADAAAVVKAGASAAAAGSMFVYQKKGYGVLIQYPDRVEIDEVLP